MHFVHKSSQGELAVIGAFLEEGAKNTEFAKVLENVPQQVAPGHEAKNQAEVIFDKTGLLPWDGDINYYRYTGSLTTPPCTEGVRWIVMQTPVEVGKEQIAEFRHILANELGLEHKSVDYKSEAFFNNRPTQPLTARKVMYAPGFFE